MSTSGNENDTSNIRGCASKAIHWIIFPIFLSKCNIWKSCIENTVVLGLENRNRCQSNYEKWKETNFNTSITFDLWIFFFFLDLAKGRDEDHSVDQQRLDWQKLSMIAITNQHRRNRDQYLSANYVWICSLSFICCGFTMDNAHCVQAHVGLSLNPPATVSPVYSMSIYSNW